MNNHWFSFAFLYCEIWANVEPSRPHSGWIWARIVQTSSMLPESGQKLCQLDKIAPGGPYVGWIWATVGLGQGPKEDLSPTKFVGLEPRKKHIYIYIYMYRKRERETHSTYIYILSFILLSEQHNMSNDSYMSKSCSC